MAKNPEQPANALALLAFKTAPDVFDLSSGLGYVSIRDQIVRARILARDIALGMPRRDTILVVGAGIAGVAFACAARRLGMDVLVVDTRDQPVAVQETAHRRYIGPHMYEWPARFHANQVYPGADASIWETSDQDCPKWGAKNPITGATFTKQIRAWLHKWIANELSAGNLVPTFATNVERDLIDAFVRAFVDEATSRKGEKHSLRFIASGVRWVRPTNATAKKREPIDFIPELVVLAGGMGVESTTLKEGLPGCNPFWEDELPPEADESVAIFGAGDGAIQEVLLCLTECNHPLKFVRGLRKGNRELKRALGRAERDLLAIDSQHKLEASWNVEMKMDWIDQRCEVLATEVAQADPVAVEALLRDRSAKLTLVTREARVGRCYLLNRFVFHVVQAYIKTTGKSALFEWRSSVEVEDVTKAAAKPYYVELSVGEPLVVDRVFVRWGVGKSELPPGLQLVGISDPKRARRTSLGQLPLPYVLPTAA